jgi:hypothetical protein
MRNNKQVEEIYRSHNTWMYKVSYNFTRNTDKSEDIIQSVYLYLLEMENIEKIRFGKGWNMMYLYNMIKTRYLSSLKHGSHETPHDPQTDWDIDTIEYNYEDDQEFERRLGIIERELGDEGELGWFDKKLFRVYFEEDHSLTSLSEATKISRSSCWNSISKTKKYIKSKL